jgi:glutamate/aspartate transport system substrate-binding protein
MKRFLACLLLACAALAGGARAQDETVLSGTLKTIHDRGTILIGYRDTALPFSYLNKAGQPIGFSVDLCHGIAEDVAKALNRDLLEPDVPAWQVGVRIVYVPVTAEARLPKIVAGQIDLECGSTTANAEREKTVAFSPIFFLAGTKLLVADPTITSFRSLGGRTVVGGTGTTNAGVIHRLAATMKTPPNVIEAPNLDAAFDMLAAGKADAMASDDILLAGYAATRPGGRRFSVVGDYLSYEPYAIGFRRDDPQFAALVRSSFERMASEGDLTRLYNKWLVHRLPTGQTLNLLISPHLAEMYRALGQPD